jgi:hypothetical protein
VTELDPLTKEFMLLRYAADAIQQKDRSCHKTPAILAVPPNYSWQNTLNFLAQYNILAVPIIESIKKSQPREPALAAAPHAAETSKKGSNVVELGNIEPPSNEQFRHKYNPGTAIFTLPIENPPAEVVNSMSYI